MTIDETDFSFDIYGLRFDIYPEGGKWHVAAVDLRTDEECKSGLIPQEHLYRMELASTATILGGDEGFSTRQAAVATLTKAVEGVGDLPFTASKLRLGSLKDGELFWFRGQEYRRRFDLDAESGAWRASQGEESGRRDQNCAVEIIQTSPVVSTWADPDTLVIPRNP